MTRNPLTGVLFDVDGTLVDTTFLHTVCWWEALRQYGDRRADGRLRNGHDGLFGEYHDRLRPFPGAAELLRACAGQGLTVVLASSASERELRALRAALDADEAVAAATSSADAEESKPAPDIVAAALRQAGLAPAQTLFVGDTVWDVAAARELAMGCVAVACGGTNRAELAEAGALAVYDDPADLLANLDRSPLMEPG
jgi:HAD superfamily hydrolase (TIGR01509 family)